MRTFSITVTLAVLVAACGSGAIDTPNTTDPLLPPTGFGEELVVFETCDDLLDYYVEHAVDLVGPYGLPGSSTTTAGR